MAQRSLSSSINYRWTYDVFLSFRGEDTRLGFVGHLYDSLRQRGIQAFIDDESIRIGEEITESLFKAIQESRIAIIVFSENYASSTFCLDELVQILQCFEEQGRLVYPVFYYVDPSDLRNQRGSYGKSLDLLEKRFKDDKQKQKVQKWRLAVSKAADLKGWHLKPGIANERECITKIISEVFSRVNHDPLDITRYLVGLVPRVKEVISLLELWSTKKTKMVGIWGVSGIGKSTIVRALCNLIANNFEGVCFLSNVRKESQMPNGLAHLQEKLLLKLVMEKDLKLGDFHEGIPIIKRRLCQKKILLILDDVDGLKQLEALAGNCDWFGLGSRIVITTRNKQLLVAHDVNRIYNVRELNDEDSLQLLSWYAFKKENVESDFLKVSNRAIQYCCGLPLAIEVLISNLRGKGVNEWHCALDQCERSQGGPVLESFRSSYDALGEIEKNIFLDLACFFKGENLRKVKGMLHCLHEIQPDYIIGVLIDKALINIEGDRVGMQGLIEDMGKMIVRQQSPGEPSERSRLWYYQDILHVLKRNTGTNKVEVIILNLPEGSEVQIKWSRKAFMKMENLKMLVIKNVSFSKCPKYLPNGLRWLEWKGYPFKVLPYNICSTELVYLDLSYSNFESLQPFTKKFHSLSCMNFRNCKFLQQTPNFSGVSNLRELWLDDCTNLIEIHHSVGGLNKLKELSVMRCNNLKIMPHDLRLTSLERLSLFGCSSLQSFPEISVNMKNMHTLDLERTSITELPPSICNLIGLETLIIEECPNLEQLPAGICLLPKLWTLNANSCKRMRHFKMYDVGEEADLYCYTLSLKLKRVCFSNCNLSEDSLALCLSYFTNMTYLDLSSNYFTTLPACIKECHHLRYLLLNNCKRLQHIEDMPPNLERFSAVCCMLLTRSSKSKLLYQALSLQPGKRNFILPGGKLPENLDKYGRESSVSFWVRDVLPTVFPWILVKDHDDFLSNCAFLVHINNTKVDISYEWLLLSTMKMGHLHICDLQSMIGKAKLSHAYKWNHVKISIKRKTQNIKSKSEIHFALHVYKLQNNSNTIRFMDPRTYDDCNPWKRVQKPQNCEELEDGMPHLDIDTRMANLHERAYPSRWTYDVFLSYGDDYGSSFVSRLCHCMCARRIRVLPNDEFLTPSVEEFNAMEESRTAIIIISENYASSTSCLNSLATILECFRKECRSVYMIFYNMEPPKLQYQTGNCEVVFAMLEEKLKHNKQQVQQWRLALSEVVSRGGYYCFNPRNMAEDKFIQGFINAISSSINAFPFRIWDNSVGLESRVQEIISLLDVGSNEEVKMVGICGICGIGKSTIASAVCNFIAHHFEDLWYFSPISEEHRFLNDSPFSVRLYEKARGKRFSLDDFHGIIRQPWFRQRKVLVILDGVEGLDHLQAVNEGCDWFGCGSRIIITTRDTQLLVSHGIEKIYDVMNLSDDEGFSNAFLDCF
ncbi:TMV resistance protein N-like isoform X2 [Prosopis cineraria]|uniref:TMV resistance protein N-like isoform X2 n=1 Tax=Prosopis cineraria TaxID=364024 RepID=UPI00241021CD|nr:TMV resistance protein N-like isoform X2 [Prosopis cineraria]